MKHSHFTRMLAACLAVCLLPALAFAYNGDDTPVTRSELSVRLRLYSDGFPNDGAAHYAGWSAFLDKISLRGVQDTQHLLMPLNRVYFDGGLYLNDRLTLPFTYDSYMTYRYVRSPALGGASLHLNTNNFLQFMLKGYYFMGLPTQLIGLAMYPESPIELALRYRDAASPLLDGRGSRTVSSRELRELCRRLNSIVGEDLNDKAYYFFTCLLVDLGASDMMLEKLACWEDWLDAMDPDGDGLRIEADGERETWTLGETTVFDRDESGFIATLLDAEGYAYTLECRRDGNALDAQLLVTLEQEERLNLTLSSEGLPLDGALAGDGWVELSLTGEALYEEVADQRFLFRYARSAQALPYHTALEVDWVHPETGEAALGLCYEADKEEQAPDVLVERRYDDKDDFFHLNESYMAEYKERFGKTLALAALPFALEMPLGLYSDIVAFLDQTGFLAFLGVE